MPPTVILVRHAEAMHNKTNKFFYCDWDLHDPPLTDLGLQQSRELGETLQKRLPGWLDVDLVLVSPMQRTLQTAMEALGGWLVATGEEDAEKIKTKKKVPIVAHAGWQETTSNPCDVGSAIAEMARAFPGVDFSKVDDVYPDKTETAAGRELYGYTQKALVARGQRMLEELHGRPEAVILVVSHSAFLSKAVAGSMFGNADFRIFSFEGAAATDVSPPAPVAEGLPPLRYRLQEWAETRSSGGMGWSYDQVREIGEGMPQ